MALDPVVQSLIDAGLMDASGNWLVDPTTGATITGTTFDGNPNGGQLSGVDPTGNPLYAHYQVNPGTTGGGVAADQPPVDPFAKLNSDYATAASTAKTRGLTDAQWAASVDFKNIQSQVVGLYGTTTDQSKLASDIAFFESQLHDPVMGANARTLRDAAQNQLSKLTNPLSPYTQFNIGPTSKTEDQLNADRTFIQGQANEAFTNLLNFQREQADATKELADQIRLSREFAIPHPPEQSGKFIAGGTSAQTAAPRVGMSDLLIRF